MTEIWVSRPAEFRVENFLPVILHRRTDIGNGVCWQFFQREPGHVIGFMRLDIFRFQILFVGYKEKIHPDIEVSPVHNVNKL